MYYTRFSDRCQPRILIFSHLMRKGIRFTPDARPLAGGGLRRRGCESTAPFAGCILPAGQIRMSACPPPHIPKARESVSSTHSEMIRQPAKSSMQVRITRRTPSALQSRNG